MNTLEKDNMDSESTVQNNSFKNIFFNILIPVMILNKGKLIGLSPKSALIIAIAFPLCYGAWDFYKERKMNYIALLGLINVAVSGVFTLLALGGLWFALKEAFFPLLIGIFVFGSSYSNTPFFKTLFLNPAVVDTEKLERHLDTAEKKSAFHNLIVESNKHLSLSFVLSAILNFSLAMYIFKPMDLSLSLETQQDILNQQLGQMTLYSMIVILVPSMIVVGLIMYRAFKKMTSITGLSLEDIMIDSSKKTVKN